MPPRSDFAASFGRRKLSTPRGLFRPHCRTGSAAVARSDATNRSARAEVDGDILSKFIEFLFQSFGECAEAYPESVGGELRSLSCLSWRRQSYAGAIVEALRGSPVKISIPAAGSDAETRRYNDDLLMNCDGVTLCSANASEVWVRSEADRLKDWEALGRKQQFAFRNLIAGAAAGRAQARPVP